jgi:AcrR family transcriptional regulator
MPARVYASARSRILDAAERLIRSRGAGQLSVDAVAAEAKVSKGGFFHHFASKDELLLAIVERLIERVNAEITAKAANDPEPRGARLRAQIALAFDMDTEGYKQLIALPLALLQVASTQPSLARRGRQLNAETFARDEAEDIPLGRAIAVQFALDGYALAVGLGGTTLSPRQKTALQDSLMALARPEARPPRRSKKGKRP